MDPEFRRRNEAQFVRARDSLQQLGRRFIELVAADLTEGTPGFGNQAPSETKYIPTGRLRGGLNYTREPIGRSAKGLYAARGEEGPFSDYGRETLDRITEQLKSDRMGGISYLENDVGYGDLLLRGAANHAAVGPRDWPKATQTRQALFARQAVQSLRGGR